MLEVLEILESFDGSMTTRQVYYQLVSRGAVENCDSAYERVQRLLVNMRRGGVLPYYRIVDRSRPKHHKQGWDSALDVIELCAQQYRRDRWADQEVIVQIALEKQALEGIFAEVCDHYGCSLWVQKGFASVSFIYEWAREIERLTASGKHVVIAYFGDFDPSGLCLERKTVDGLMEQGAVFEWSRHGLVWDDFDAFNLVNVPVKARDSRARAYLKQYGNRAAELDALPPAELQTRIRITIESHIDVASWDRLESVERAEQESIFKITKNWDRALAAAEAAE